ncbi:glycosyltransferase [Oceanobacillus halophilus]|uniref:Glycosyltransferase n=1 Tax=Oceanobacillus halophilus TaxID=930130 RepID=A0A495A2G5_9BACI|nr:glycosyltransferase [Oceanobacillus halophilus]RKQ33487.1 glycosyltransferase [Oceanobacillus halophilus]
MKKKVVFMIINMNVGGTEKALLNMIAELPKENFEVTILMLEKYGGFLDLIPNHVHIEYVSLYDDIRDMVNNPPLKVAWKTMEKGKVISACSIIILHLLSKLRKERSIFYFYLLKNVPVMKTKFDIAVAYAGPMDLISYFIATKVNAKKKVQWIHFDITKIGFNKYFAAKVYKRFDKIFVVSNEGKEKVINQLPVLKHKTEVFFNLISANLITEAAIEGKGFQDDFNGIRIVTVGRLTVEKGQDLAIKACSKLIENGFNIRWYCVGEGDSRIRYEEMIDNLHLNEHFILLGEDPNPYQYIKDCDIYVQPSKHEGYCITLAEARALRKPIVTTNFIGAIEQIKNNETGIIVNVDEFDIYQAVKELINHPKQCREFSSNLSKETHNNKFEMEKIYRLV